MPAAGEFGVEVVLHGVEPQALESTEFGPVDADLDQVGQDRAAPQAQRVAQQRGGLLDRALRLLLAPLAHPRVEEMHVDLLRVHPHHVAGRPGQQGGALGSRGAPAGQDAAQAVDRVLEDLATGRGGVVHAPQGVEQLARRHDSIGL